MYNIKNNETKIYGIVYESQLQKKEAIYLIPASNSNEANSKGLEQLINELGDLIWKPKMMAVLSFEQEPIKDKNYLLKCIIDNKDKNLLQVGKKYLTDYEIKYVEDKI